MMLYSSAAARAGRLNFYVEFVPILSKASVKLILFKISDEPLQFIKCYQVHFIRTCFLKSLSCFIEKLDLTFMLRIVKEQAAISISYNEFLIIFQLAWIQVISV